jgi:GH15 family glucan-1,4-alpha-glucosidase
MPRLLRQVEVKDADGRWFDVNQRMLRDGMAVWFPLKPELGNVHPYHLAAEQARGGKAAQAAPDGWFRQAADVDTVDAATLLVPAFGFLPASHPYVERTVAAVRDELEKDGLVQRYRVDDGVPGGEGAFLLCSFWLLDCLTYSGRLADAEALLARLLELGNDVGLFAEEADGTSGAALGNFPQAFTHMALVTSCGHLAAARRGELDHAAPVDFADAALQRLLAGTDRAVTPPGRVE